MEGLAATRTPPQCTRLVGPPCTRGDRVGGFFEAPRKFLRLAFSQSLHDERSVGIPTDLSLCRTTTSGRAVTNTVPEKCVLLDETAFLIRPGVHAWRRAVSSACAACHASSDTIWGSASDERRQLFKSAWRTRAARRPRRP